MMVDFTNILSDKEAKQEPEPDPKPDVDQEEEILAALEYARLYGLCTDYTTEQPDINEIPTASDAWKEADFRLPPEVSLTNPAAGLTNERLAVTKEAALLLKSVLSLSEPAEADFSSERRLRRMNRGLRLEIPILRTDHLLDCAAFGSTDVPNLENSRIPLEVVDEEKGEGLQWPSSYLEYPHSIFAKAQAEKLSVSKDVILFLQDALRDSWKPEDSEKMKAEESELSRNRTVRHITPPLLPLSPPVTPYVPSSPGNHLELIPDSNDSLEAERKEINDRLMREDAIAPTPKREDSDESMLYDFITQDEEVEKLPSPALKRKINDLRVEGPLTPPMLSESPAKKLKTVTFNDQREYIQGVPTTFEQDDAVFSDNEDYDAFFKTIEPSAEKTMKVLENEKLSEVDTTRRVDVPVLDFTLPSPPWEEFSRKATGRSTGSGTELNTQRKFLSRVERYLHKTTPSWHGVSKLDRELTWAVFPIQMARISVEEKLHGEDNVAKLLSELTLGEIATSSTDLWKRDGLRILEDNDSDEELEVADFGDEESEDNLESMIRKRKLELDEEEKDTANAQHKKLSSAPGNIHALQEQSNQLQAQQQSGTPQKLQEPKPTPVKSGNYDLMFGGKFSTSTALKKFMELHGKSIARDENQNNENTAPPAPPMYKKPAPVQAPNPDKQVPQVSAPALPALPSIPEHLPPCSFMISSTLWRHRHLSRELRQLYEKADFIERDFTLSHSPADEADVLLSPSTGLIFTTLQQIKQRALPGQRDTSPIKERIVTLQARYERLIVLISEGLTREAEQQGSSRPVDTRDQEALQEFKTFTDNMEAEVIGKYVPGGELALSRTIVQEMAKWGLPHGSDDIGDLKLLEEETTWEVFLRRAGLNPYAAQIILASLKGPYNIPLSSSSPYTSATSSSEKVLSMKSLAAFVHLSAEERKQWFQVLLGGSRILGRVSARLDVRWLSAANGFRGTNMQL